MPVLRPVGFEGSKGGFSVETFALIIESPGQVDMTGISVMASALGVPVRSLSQAIYRAPSVLARDLPAENLPELLDHCANLGLDAAHAPNDVTLPENADTFELAVHIENAARIPHAVETLARVTGVAAEQAFRMLAIPPGQVLGNVGAAAIDALRQRFGAGIEVKTAIEGDGPFDLYLSRSMASVPVLRDLVGHRKGLIPLGLTVEEATALHPRLPKGTARLLPRAFLRFDVVLAPRPTLSPLAGPLLAELFGVAPAQVPLLQAHAPLALAERLPFKAASEAVDRAVAADLPVSLEASGFEHCDLVVEAAHDRAALADVLGAAGWDVPDRLPARVAADLPDLDARWLAHSLERVGARIRFEDGAP